MGHMIENIVVEGEKPPFIQALVVSKSTKLPSDGLKEFKKDYPSLSKAKKLDYVLCEYENIFNFGTRWEILLSELGIESGEGFITKKGNTLHNPYGSEGSPEHRRLRDYISTHPEIIGLTAKGIVEYPLKSGDYVDIVFETSEEIVGIEVKSLRSGEDDLLRGLFQCIKYKAILDAEDLVQGKERKVKTILVLENSLSKELLRICRKLNVVAIENFRHHVI